MDRFIWESSDLAPEDEALVLKQDGVSLEEEGSVKTPYLDGTVTLTTHRLLWRDPREPSCRLALRLANVLSAVKEPAASWRASPRLGLRLAEQRDLGPAPAACGPVQRSTASKLCLAFRRAGQEPFLLAMQETLAARVWVLVTAAAGTGSKRAVGIVGIERGINEHLRSQDRSIAQAFEDLDQLMRQAKDMVSLSRHLSAKLSSAGAASAAGASEQQLSDAEAAQFRGYLLSLGISEPVTRESAGAGRYHRELARQLDTFLAAPVAARAGVMSLTDAYCFVNRARGLELLSPEDVLAACQQLAALSAPPAALRLKRFDGSGALVLQLAGQDEDAALADTVRRLAARTHLTAPELSRGTGLSVTLAAERLLVTERRGLACRDDTAEGLRFYVNRFSTLFPSPVE